MPDGKAAALYTCLLRHSVVFLSVVTAETVPTLSDHSPYGEKQIVIRIGLLCGLPMLKASTPAIVTLTAKVFNHDDVSGCKNAVT